jgi:serine/threonine-protein kinase
LVVRAIDELEARMLPGISNARGPFFSPDSHWIAFFDGADLKRVAVTGGPAAIICRLKGRSRGASWGDDNTIVYATTSGSTGLWRVSADGGEPAALTTPVAAQQEGAHSFPSVLPNALGVLFTISAIGQTEGAQVAVLDFKTGQRKTIIRGGSQAEYVPTGHLIYAAAGALRAVRFDLDRLDVIGDSAPVVEHIMAAANSAANYAASRSGTLVYVPAGVSTISAPRSLVWVDRKGHETALKASPRAYAGVRVSPDGSRLAVEVDTDIWTWDLSRETMMRLTFDPSADVLPVWTPDSRRIVFTSIRAGVPNLYIQAANGTGTAERLTTSNNPQYATSITSDGKRILGYEYGPQTARDVMIFPFGDSAVRTEQLVHTPFDDYGAAVAPNGRYFAYHSNESGRFEIYVRSFPDSSRGSWQVSTAGGRQPIWARNGRELFYLDAKGVMTAVPVETDATTFSAGNPTTVLETSYATPQNGGSYDVSPDGRRFLMIKDNGGADPNATPANFVVVLNWFEELKARVPLK